MSYKNESPQVICDLHKDCAVMVNGVIQRDVSGEPLLDEKKWLTYRKQGIGGSNASAITGNSPWTCKKELQDDKLGIEPAVKRQFNELSKEIGHLTENHIREQMVPYLMKKVFGVSLKHGDLGTDSRMFKHGNPEYSFALADLDGWIKVNGELGVLEIKTTNWRNSHTINEYWSQGIVPPYYADQVRHYMAVTNLPFAYICCAWGFNPETEAVIIRVDRNMALEEQLMEQEKTFWEEHVQKKLPVKMEEETCSPSVVERYYGARVLSKKNKTAVNLSSLELAITRWEQIQVELEDLKSQKEALEEELSSLNAKFIDELGTEEHGSLENADGKYDVYASSVIGRASYDVEGVKLNEPDLYEKCHKDTIVVSKLTASEKARLKGYRIEGSPTGERKIKIVYHEKEKLS